MTSGLLSDAALTSPYIQEYDDLCTRTDYHMFTTYCSTYGSAIVLEIEIT